MNGHKTHFSAICAVSTQLCRRLLQNPTQFQGDSRRLGFEGDAEYILWCLLDFRRPSSILCSISKTSYKLFNHLRVVQCSSSKDQLQRYHRYKRCKQCKVVPLFMQCK